MSSRLRRPIHAIRLTLAAVIVACGPATHDPPAASPRGATVTPEAASPVASTRPASVPFRAGSLEFVSEQVGWIAALGGPLYRTTSSGWIAMPTVPERVLLTVDFVGTQIGWAIARYAPAAGCGSAVAQVAPPCQTAVLSTHDGGATWDERLVVPFTASGTGADLPVRLAAIDRDTAWALLADAAGSEVRLTTDGGLTWRVVLTVRGIAELIADSARGAWVIAPSVTGADVLRTMDAGATWRPQLNDSAAYALTRTGSHLWVLERDGAYCTASACSEYGLRHSADAGATWSELGNPMRSATCAGGHLGRPSFSDRDLLTGYIPISLGAGGVRVGEGGLLVTTDGGRTWSCETTPPNVVRVVAVMGTAYAVSEDRASGGHTVWRRDRSRWTMVFP